MTYKQSDVVNFLKSQFPEINKDQILEILRSIETLISHALSTQQEVNFLFGKFSVRLVPESTARNPQTGESITVPAHFRPNFKFFPAFKEAIQSPLSLPKPVERPEQVKSLPKSDRPTDSRNPSSGEVKDKGKKVPFVFVPPKKPLKPGQANAPTKTKGKTNSAKSSPAKVPSKPTASSGKASSGKAKSGKTKNISMIAGVYVQVGSNDPRPMRESDLARLSPNTQIYTERTGWTVAGALKRFKDFFRSKKAP